MTSGTLRAKMSTFGGDALTDVKKDTYLLLAYPQLYGYFINGLEHHLGTNISYTYIDTTVAQSYDFPNITGADPIIDVLELCMANSACADGYSEPYQRCTKNSFNDPMNLGGNVYYIERGTIYVSPVPTAASNGIRLKVITPISDLTSGDPSCTDPAEMVWALLALAIYYNATGNPDRASVVRAQAQEMVTALRQLTPVSD